MRIDSSFPDFYDRVTAFEADPSVVYVRETRVERFSALVPSPFVFDGLPSTFPSGPASAPERRDEFLARDWDRTDSCEFHVIGFCGHYVLCLTDGFANATTPYERVYFGEELLDLEWSTAKRRNSQSERDAVVQCLERLHGFCDDTLFRHFNTPVFVAHCTDSLTKYETKNEALYGPTCTVDPRLSDFLFVKFSDPYSTYQRIEAYLSGVLGSPEPSIGEPPNDVKIVKAGFDSKSSFRKRT
jgi:hypothetical protein